MMDIKGKDSGKFIKENIGLYISDVKSVVDDGGKFFLRITGTSMLPFLKNGRDVAVLSKPSGLKKYETAFYVRSNGHVVLHRIVAEHGGFYDFCGDHQTEIEKNIPKENVIAVMREYEKDGKLYSCNKMSYKIKAVLWVKSRLVRKYSRKIKIKIKHLVKQQ
ncbi:MAG: hypothetical protein IJZ94_04240 [Clostridia bacterium]|nr:hypothetical protein [Clostridia bacterium]